MREDGLRDERRHVHPGRAREAARAGRVRRDAESAQKFVRGRVVGLEERGGAEAVDQEVVPADVRGRRGEQVEELQAAGLWTGQSVKSWSTRVRASHL